MKKKHYEQIIYIGYAQFNYKKSTRTIKTE